MNQNHVNPQPPSNLPGGTVTFLFTDIEGSTRLLQRLRERYAGVLADQRRILRTAFEKWGGQEVDTQGDSFFVSFPRAGDALAAILEAQRELAAYPWPEGEIVRVRMGLHTGEPWLAEEGYVGIDVHRAARIAHVGHGGQVLLSETTAALVRNDLPEGVSLRDLGKHRLKDIRNPEPISQLVIAGLPSDFPPLRSLDARPNNLPTQPTPFVGRAQELEALGALIADPAVRLVTILGAGGMGKTRLALAAAEEQLLATSSTNGKTTPRFPNGVFFVALAPLEQADAILSTVAEAVGFQFYQGVEPRQQLLDYFRQKRTLLVMDNFEHLLGGTELLTEILGAAPGVKALATSREKLNLRGETIYSLWGMRFPDDGALEVAVHLQASRYSAVQLFVQSARRARPGFKLQADDMKSVARICRLVGGMPLGIELAAAWVEMLSLEEIAAEIQGSLDFLEGEMRDAPERHLSVRAVFDHTWKMLNQAERDAFKRLSVFRGGFTREAAGHVTGASLRQLLALVSKSLIRRNKEGRYEIHELLRQYAAGKLDQTSAEREEVRDLHCEYYAEFLHRREADIRGGDQHQALMEMDNIRAGWRWSVMREKLPEIRKQLHSLMWLYEFNGWYQEGEANFEWAAGKLRTEEPVGEKGIAYGQVLVQLGGISHRAGHYVEGVQFIRDSQAILRQLGARAELAWANVMFSFTVNPADYPEAVQCLQESLAIYREMGIHWGMAFTLNTLGNFALEQADYEQAEHHYREAIQIARDLNDPRSMGWSISGLGDVAFEQGAYTKARGFYEECYTIFEVIGYKLMVCYLSISLGDVALRLGEYETAQKNYEEALGIGEDSGNQGWIADAVNHLGEVAFAMGEFENAKERYQEALSIFQSLGDQTEVGFIFDSLGNVAMAMGGHQKARGKYLAALEIGMDAQYVDLCLRVLAGLAALLERTGQAERAVELAALALSHPQSGSLTREKARKRLDDLEARLPPEVFAATQERGKARDLEATAKELLAELELIDSGEN